MINDKRQSSLKSLMQNFRAIAIFTPDIFSGYLQLLTSFNDSEEILFIKISEKSHFLAKIITLAPGTIAFFQDHIMCVHCLSSSKDVFIKHLRKFDPTVEISTKKGG